MADIDERGKAFENKFAHDEQMQFKASARRNKLVGLWAAEKMCKNGDAAEAYAKEVVIADFEEAGDDDVLRKVLADMEEAGITITRDELRHKMDELMLDAQEQVVNEA